MSNKKETTTAAFDLAQVFTPEKIKEICDEKKITPLALIDLQLEAIGEKSKTLLPKVNTPGAITTHKIHPVVCRDKEGIIAIGYLKEPNLQAKMAMLDMALQNPFSCAEQIYETYLIREESDPRMYNKDPENDAFYITGVQAANELVKAYSNQFKKK